MALVWIAFWGSVVHIPCLHRKRSMMQNGGCVDLIGIFQREHVAVSIIVRNLDIAMSAFLEDWWVFLYFCSELPTWVHVERLSRNELFSLLFVLSRVFGDLDLFTEGT